MLQSTFHPAGVDLSKLSFLVTGGAGFIGSHLVEYLIKNKAGKVVVIDNLSTGNINNIQFAFESDNFQFIEGDICDLTIVENGIKNVDYVLHQAALGSVPRSVNNPIATNKNNIDGFLNVLWAAKEHQVKRMVYASSSSVFGDSKIHPKVEENIGIPLSPYAVTKRVNELYAKVFSDLYGLGVIGLRYFNIFGQRQHPTGAYAAAIPLFISALMKGEKPIIFGDGKQTRDFTFVENAVQANIKALFVEDKNALGEVFNIAFGEEISLLDLLDELKSQMNLDIIPLHKEERTGDVKHSLASTDKAFNTLGYKPNIGLKQGLEQTIEWYKSAHSEM